MSYDFDQSQYQAESFEFTLGGHKYNFEYPTTEDLESIQTMLNEKGEPDLDQINAKIYSYIKPVDEKSPSIKDALKVARVPQMRAFRKMINVEFGLEG